MATETVGLVPAAGSGMRLGKGPKGFLKLGGITLMSRAVNVLMGCVGRILVGVPCNYIDQAQAELDGLAEVYAGGSTRQETVFLLLQKCIEPIVLIQDATRPFPSRSLVLKVIEGAEKHGAAVPFIPLPIAVSRHSDGFVVEAIPRSEVLLNQSPQGYSRTILEQAYESALKNAVEFQSTMELVLGIGVKVLVVPGEETNIKITTPLDWEIANKVILPLFEANKEKGK